MKYLINFYWAVIGLLVIIAIFLPVFIICAFEDWRNRRNDDKFLCRRNSGIYNRNFNNDSVDKK